MSFDSDVVLCMVIVGLVVGLAGAAQADYSFPADPGPYNVAEGTPVPVQFNDAGNSAGVPPAPAGEIYLSFTFTVD